jgi:hypothetical protein
MVHVGNEHVLDMSVPKINFLILYKTLHVMVELHISNVVKEETTGLSWDCRTD